MLEQILKQLDDGTLNWYGAKILIEHFYKKNVCLDDMKWAFKKGVHEGKLRQIYRDREDEFSKSELEYYLQNKY